MEYGKKSARNFLFNEIVDEIYKNAVAE